MINLPLSRLNNDKLYTLGFRVKEILEPAPITELGIELYFSKFIKEFEKYKKSMQRMKKHLNIVGERDRVRDTYSKTFLNHVKNYISHPDEEISKKAEQLLAELEKNGKQFYNKTYKEETSILEYIFEICDKHFSDFIVAINADVWYNFLKEAQLDFEKTLRQLSSKNADEGDIVSATSLRPGLENALRNLSMFMPLHYNVTKNEQLGKLIAQIKDEVKRF